jgi:hypothetical protein
MASKVDHLVSVAVRPHKWFGTLGFLALWQAAFAGVVFD